MPPRNRRTNLHNPKRNRLLRMTLQSMTGFARAQGRADCGTASGEWIWELRSVNGKGLDMRLRLPPGFEGLEPEVRKRIAAHFARGNVQATLQFARDESQSVPVVNAIALEAILDAVEKLRARLGSPPPAAEAILTMRGVMEPGDETVAPEDAEQRDRALLSGLDEACAALAAQRRAEGKSAVAALCSHVDAIEALVSKIEADPSRTLAAIAERLKAHLAPLIDDPSLDPQRLHQEAALLAMKADLSEEIDRLKAHVAAARELLAGDGPAGRKLDFLSQEFNRECNTICSKSNAASVTAAGLEMKALIDRFREQVQNVE